MRGRTHLGFFRQVVVVVLVRSSDGIVLTLSIRRVQAGKSTYETTRLDKYYDFK